jgi:hypothetical protein
MELKPKKTKLRLNSKSIKRLIEDNVKKFPPKKPKRLNPVKKNPIGKLAREARDQIYFPPHPTHLPLRLCDATKSLSFFYGSMAVLRVLYSIFLWEVALFLSER